MTKHTMGPREIQALRSVRGPLTEGDNRRIRMARIVDGYDLACHNLVRASKDAEIALRGLGAAIRRKGVSE